MHLNSDFHQLWGRWAALDDFMKFAANDLIVIAGLVFVLLWLRRDGLRAGLAGGIGAGIAVGIAYAIGGVWARTRPFVHYHWVPLISHGRDPSFPSDHLSALGALTIAAWIGWRRLGGVVGLMALLVAIARVYVGVHWPGDVIGGFVIGGVVAFGVWKLLAAATGPLDRLDEALQARRLRPRFALAGHDR